MSRPPPRRDGAGAGGRGEGGGVPRDGGARGEGGRRGEGAGVPRDGGAASGMPPGVRDFIFRVYGKYHRPEFIPPDPLELVLPWERVEDREIAALVASSFALGRVGGILRAAAEVLALLGPRPREGLVSLSPEDIRRGFAGFRYRFFGPHQGANFLMALRRAVLDYGSLENLFAAGMDASHETVMPALGFFADEIQRRAPGDFGILLCDPRRGSAAKRLHLFLRWMVRRDSVDPGGWTAAPPEKLVVPLDTHMHSLALRLGLTRRRSADIAAALDTTRSLRLLDPRDPVRFDFSLCRLGIRPRAAMDENLYGNSRQTLS